jgi:uncharacterized Zn-binding protein involved in type VI secretion
MRGSPDVNVNRRPALRVDDPGVHAACCGANTWTATQGSSTVFINGKGAHRMGDRTRHCGGAGQLVEGSPNVMVGESTSAVAAASRPASTAEGNRAPPAAGPPSPATTAPAGSRPPASSSPAVAGAGAGASSPTTPPPASADTAASAATEASGDAAAATATEAGSTRDPGPAPPAQAVALEASEQPTGDLTWVEVQLVDDDGEPYANVDYRMKLPDGSVREGVTDGDGLVKFDGIDPGECEIAFPTLDVADSDIAPV